MSSGVRVRESAMLKVLYPEPVGRQAPVVHAKPEGNRPSCLGCGAMFAHAGRRDNGPRFCEGCADGEP